MEKRIVLGGLCMLATACGNNDWRDVGPRFDPTTHLSVPAVPAWGPLVTSTHAPPPVAGGTLAIDAHDTAVVSDPDHDTISVVDLGNDHTRGTIVLRSGDEPGRIAFGPDGRAFVALRASGDVAVVDTTAGTLVSRVAVCASPRGLLWTGTKLAVACAEGRFVVLDPTTGVRTVDRMVAPDLRDVVTGTNGGYYVSTFRAAHVLSLTAAGETTDDLTLPTTTFTDATASARAVPAADAVGEAAVAWRMVRSGTHVLVVHQLGTLGVVPAAAASDPASPTPVVDSPYGGGGVDCGSQPTGILAAAVTAIDGRSMSQQVIGGAVLPVDIAVPPPESSGDGTTRSSVMPFDHAVVVAAGNNRLPGGQQLFAGIGDCGGSSAMVLEPAAQTVAAAYRPDGELMVLTRQPTRLYGMTRRTELTLAAADNDDTGHVIFHSNSGSGIACASCHPEGGDDGRVWTFAREGARRTQNFRGGVSQMAPYHWAGEMPSLGTIMGEVFHRRMGGPEIDSDHLATLSHWMDTIPTLPAVAVSDADVDAVARGRAVFESREFACNSCHAGALGTDNRLVDVGTGGMFVTPPLAGLRYRAPFMHDGRAATLAARFTAAGGGTDAHGHTSRLTVGQRADLVAYLQTR